MVGRIRHIVGINVAAAVGNVAVNLVLIPRFGPLGAAIGTTSTLLAFNALKHLGLGRAGIRLMPRELWTTYTATRRSPS